MKRVRVEAYGQVNKAVLKWFPKVGPENVAISSLLIREKHEVLQKN